MAGRRTAAFGVAIGLGISLAATRLVAALLFQIKPANPPALAASAAIVFTVTLAASYRATSPPAAPAGFTRW